MTQRRDGADVNALWPLDATPHTHHPPYQIFRLDCDWHRAMGTLCCRIIAKWRRALCYRCASGFRGCQTRIDAL